jgi:hypothetical protein
MSVATITRLGVRHQRELSSWLHESHIGAPVRVCHRSDSPGKSTWFGVEEPSELDSHTATGSTSRPDVPRRCSAGSDKTSICGEFSDLWPTQPAGPSLIKRGSVVTKKADLQGFKPSPGLEPGTASLPWNVSGNWWQPLATDLAYFAVSAAAGFAADCHRLQPRGSIKAPSAGRARPARARSLPSHRAQRPTAASRRAASSRARRQPHRRRAGAVRSHSRFRHGG